MYSDILIETKILIVTFQIYDGIDLKVFFRKIIKIIKIR